MKNPLVSVIIPCFNRAEYLRPTIDSILGQDYDNMECIVIDGGSKDGTVDILKSYGSRIQWVSEPDKGHADALNKGFKKAKGDIISWLNADDIYKVPDAVSLIAAAFERYPDSDLIYGKCGKIDKDGNIIGDTYSHSWDLEYAVVNCDHCIPQPSAFFKKSVFDKVGYLDENIFIKDREFWLRIALKGEIKEIDDIIAFERNTIGISFNVRKTAPALIDIADKFFANRDIPDKIRKQKRRAYSNAYLRGMDYAFYGGPVWGIIYSYALKGALIDITNSYKIFKRLIRYTYLGIFKKKR